MADLRPFEARVEERRQAWTTGEPVRPRRAVGLREFADQWFTELAASARAGRITPGTFKAYESIWANHLDDVFGDLPMAAVDAGMLRRYIDGKVAQGLSPVTANQHMTPLSAMYSDAVADGLVAVNPVRQPRRARHGASRRASLYAKVEKRTPKHLEVAEAHALLAATPDRYRDMVLAALTLGVRRGELIGLRWEDIRWADRRIDLQRQLQNREPCGCKCGSERELVLYSGLARVLGKRRRAEGYVFTAPDGRPWSNDGPERAFLVAAYEAAGLREKDRMWHTLRHTYASVLAAGGVRREVVERLTGHAGKGTLSIYTHLFKDAFDGVEEALDAVYGVNGASTESVALTEVRGTRDADV